MSFRRTSTGLRNQPVFFSADVVVYVEGVDALIDGEDASDVPMSQDGLFWANVLAQVLPDTRLHFKALGSKSALIKLSSSLDEMVRGSVLICVDSDFQNLMSATVSLNFVVPTYRYSWEADIWVWVVFLRVLASLLPMGSVPEGVKGKTRLARDRFFESSLRFVKIDAQTAITNGVECFFPRDNPAALVLANGARAPEVNRSYLKARARGFRSRLPRPWRPGISNEFNLKKHFFGKVVDRFHCQLIIFAIKSMNLPNTIPFVYLQNFAIREIGRALVEPQRSRQLDHYRSSVLSAM